MGISAGTAALLGGGISAAGSIGGSLIGSGAQTNAANDASAVQLQEFNTMQQDLQPYMNMGTTAGNQLMSELPSLTAPVTMDQATLEKTPGYQFNLNQGLESTQNSAAARGLGSSGAALKGAASYATGLADSTYQNQFANAVTNQTNTFNRLMGVTNLGQSSAAGVGAGALQTGANIGSNIIGAGNAVAGAANGAASGVANGINSGILGNILLGGQTSTPVNPVSGGVP